MKRCIWIESVLALWATRMSPCCEIFSSSNEVVPYYPYKYGKPDISAYINFIDTVYYEIQNESSYCKDCSQLKITNDKNIVINKDKRFKSILINVHEEYCNCRCVYCGQNANMRNKPQIDLAGIIQDLITCGYINDDCVFDWGGGESTILENFESLSRRIAENGYRQHIFTNGIVLSQSICELLGQGAGNNITISLDAGEKKTFTAIKRVDAFSVVTENIRRYLEAAREPSSVFVKYIIMDKNNSYEDISCFLDLCQCLGVKNILTSTDYKTRRQGGISAKTLSAAQYMFEEAKRRQCFQWCGPFHELAFEQIANRVFRGEQA